MHQTTLQTCVTLSLICIAACGNHTHANLTDAGVDSARPDASLACEDVLFGEPNAQSGLDEAQCRPTCGCDGAPWRAPTWSNERINALLAWTLTAPAQLLTSDPYDVSAPNVDANAVCAVRILDRELRS